MEPEALRPFLEGNGRVPAHLIPLAKESINNQAESIKQLDEEISVMQRILDKARKARKAEALHLEKLSSLMPASIRLPNEILGLIMAFALGNKPFSSVEYQTYARLRSVCRAWKDVAHTAPNLCCGLELDLMEEEWYPPGDEEYSCLKWFETVMAPWFALAMRVAHTIWPLGMGQISQSLYHSSDLPIAELSPFGTTIFWSPS
jgi:F-box-like